jgi:hypothetical protein
MQIAQAMSAHQPPISCKTNIALEHARAHSRTRVFGLHRFLRELQRAPAAVPDAEVGNVHGLVFAGREFGFERAGGHVVDEVVRAGTEGDEISVLGAGGIGGGCGREGEGDE